jgi:hypothetical protein
MRLKRRSMFVLFAFSLDDTNRLFFFHISRAREALWASFQASISEVNATPQVEKPMVKIEKRYLFAGKEVTLSIFIFIPPTQIPHLAANCCFREIVEVPEDSADAKKWPLWKQPESESSVASSSSIPDPTHSISEPALLPSHTLSDVAAAARKRPGPRKSKLSLAALPSPSAPKPKKLTTLDKSAMDWRAHVNSGTNSQLKDELEANRRGGGYLEKVEFMKRVDERKEAALDAVKSGKRRKL